jgi:asparagine synthetase B (glutamine-hydrolysing)
MCGICGVVGNDDERLVAEMTRLLAHRGPDGDGTRVFALTASIPPGLKLRGLTRKCIFKRSFEAVLPHDVVWRRKAGFGAPIRAWLVGDLKGMVHDLLSSEAVRARGLFDPTEVERLIRANETGQEDNALRVWALLTLELWYRTFIDGADAPAPPAHRHSHGEAPSVPQAR